MSLQVGLLILRYGAGQAQQLQAFKTQLAEQAMSVLGEHLLTERLHTPQLLGQSDQQLPIGFQALLQQSSGRVRIRVQETLNASLLLALNGIRRRQACANSQGKSQQCERASSLA